MSSPSIQPRVKVANLLKSPSQKKGWFRSLLPDRNVSPSLEASNLWSSVRADWMTPEPQSRDEGNLLTEVTAHEAHYLRSLQAPLIETSCPSDSHARVTSESKPSYKTVVYEHKVRHTTAYPLKTQQCTPLGSSRFQQNKH